MTHYRLARCLTVVAAFALVAAGCDAGSTAPPSTSSPLDLRPDGIGAAEIGQPPDAVTGELNAFFGEPDVDSGWIAADSPLYGSCPGVTMRAYGWGSLYLFFVADEPVPLDAADSAGRWFSYSYGYDFSRNEGQTDPRGLALTTTAGVGLGSSRADLRTAYPGVVEEYNAAADTWTFEAEVGDTVLRGLLDGPGDDARVALVETSPGCELS